MKKWLLIIFSIVLLVLLFLIYKNRREMIITGKVLDINSKPFDDPDLKIVGLSYTKKCRVTSSGDFTCKLLFFEKGKNYGIYLSDQKNDKGFVLQYFSGSPGKTLDLGVRRAPWER